MKRRHLPAFIIFLIGLLFFIVTFFKYIPPLLFNALIVPPPLPPEELFRRYVLNPIPESVANVRADQPKKFRGYRYTFRFNINRDDLGLLISTRPFVRVWNVKYEDGHLRWNWDRGSGLLGLSKYSSGIPCYYHTREPRWFRPGQWNAPEAYAFWKKGNLVNTETFEKESYGPTNIKILLYNDNEAEAYFVVTRYEH